MLPLSLVTSSMPPCPSTSPHSLDTPVPSRSQHGAAHASLGAPGHARERPCHAERAWRRLTRGTSAARAPASPPPLPPAWSAHDPTAHCAGHGHGPRERPRDDLAATASTRSSPEKAAPGRAAASIGFTIIDNVAAHPPDARRSPDAPSDPLLPPRSPLLLAVDDDNPWPFDHRLIQRPPFPYRFDGAREHEVYQLGNGGSLIFEHDLNALSDHLGRPHPEFHGAQVADQPGGELQWIITADLRGKMEPPTSERILFSFMESNWLDGLARALQEGLARLCGMSGEALKHPRFSHLARRNSAGEPMDMSSHPELKHHVEHLDFILYHTQQDLDHSREYANQTHARIIEQGDAIKMLANDRRTLRQQRAKRDATITRLRAKIAALEATVKAQEEQMKKMEEDGEDIQGGSTT
ncbi:hypothetical protein QYE76_015127 [Lolium multiflorum]|uniref:Uncharacterized protein n=1 Tax=Lolium multiflorum TaxID=4521 RepID=A0AAD8U693_LOLMU|nr:hypothetical protein QYE76_015127 [Lolium multiflorum]